MALASYPSDRTTSAIPCPTDRIQQGISWNQFRTQTSVLTSKANMRLMDDINLDRVIVSRDGKTPRLEFIDMQQGASAGVLECINVILINYHNVLNSEGLAEYVGQVDVDEFGEEPARRRLEELRFQFLDPLGRTRVPEGRTMYHVHVEGGEICIDVCCGDYRLTTDHEKGP